MSISILAFEHSNTLYFVLVPLAFLAFAVWNLTFFSLADSFDTDYRSILKISGNALAVFIVGVVWVGSVIGIYNLSHRHVEAQERFASTVQEELGLSVLLPVEEPVQICSLGSEQDSTEYTWVYQDGSAAHGFITKTAEVDGQCLYTFQAWA